MFQSISSGLSIFYLNFQKYYEVNIIMIQKYTMLLTNILVYRIAINIKGLC